MPSRAFDTFRICHREEGTVASCKQRAHIYLRQNATTLLK